ncbi:MAG: tetratricopeptide repeat protein [Steroidobacteraceae bacterium]
MLALIAAVTSACVMAACNSLRAPPPFPQPAPESGSAQPQPASPGQPPPGAASRPAPRQFHLGPASSALVTQAHKQAGEGDFGRAAATIERAMRIEPDNPLLWIELGRVRFDSGDSSQANSMGHKALALATGDPQTQASAWRLIADSLRALRRNPQAAEADKRANALSPR